MTVNENKPYPSIMSMWRISAPDEIILAASEARLLKSLESMDGAILTFGILTGAKL